MKTYNPLLQQVLDETAVERKRITDHSKAVRENEALREILKDTIKDFKTAIIYIKNSSIFTEFDLIIEHRQSQLNNLSNKS